MWLFTKSEYYGAQTTLECATCLFDDLENGAYYENCAAASEKLHDICRDADLAEKLYEASAEWTRGF